MEIATSTSFAKFARNDVLLEGLCCEPNKALTCKCFTGKFLIAENNVFEIKLTIGTNNKK